MFIIIRWQSEHGKCSKELVVYSYDFEIATNFMHVVTSRQPETATTAKKIA